MIIFETRNYRKIIKKKMNLLAKNGYGEINRIAEYCNFHPSLLSQVLSGSKDLSLEQAQLVAEYFGFSSSEIEYFLLLVQWERSGTEKLKNLFSSKIEKAISEAQQIKIHVPTSFELSEADLGRFYSHSSYQIVWLLTSLSGGITLGQVQEKTQISRDKTSEILEFLHRVGLCNYINGRYIMTSQSVHLPSDSVHISKHHSNWRIKSIDRSHEITKDEFMYSAPVSMSHDDFKSFREKLLSLVKEFSNKVIDSAPEMIGCLNVDLIKIIELQKSK